MTYEEAVALKAEECCQYCMGPAVFCPMDASCDAGMERRLEALEDEMSDDDWRSYVRRRIHMLINETT